MIAQTFQTEPNSVAIQVAAPSTEVPPSVWDEVDLDDLNELADKIKRMMRLVDAEEDISKEKAEIFTVIEFLALQLRIPQDFCDRANALHKASLAECGLRQALTTL